MQIRSTTLPSKAAASPATIIAGQAVCLEAITTSARHAAQKCLQRGTELETMMRILLMVLVVLVVVMIHLEVDIVPVVAT